MGGRTIKDERGAVVSYQGSERHRLAKHKWYLKNKARVQEATNRYKREHPDKRKAWVDKYRAKNPGWKDAVALATRVRKAKRWLAKAEPPNGWTKNQLRYIANAERTLGLDRINAEHDARLAKGGMKVRVATPEELARWG